MQVWEWICTMPSRRRKQLVRAFKAREELGEDSPEYEIIKAFVKTELLPYFGVADGDYSVFQVEYVARLIQAPHDETHLDAGPYLKPLVQRLKETWSWEHWLFYASVSPEKLDKWLNKHRGATSWFWSDYSSFDSTYSAHTWRMIERFYQQIYPEAPESLWKALNAWRKPHGKVRSHRDDAKLEYFAPIMNASGRDDTALANALVNGIVLALSFTAVLAGKSIESLEEADVLWASRQFSIAVVGDDSLVACSFDVRPLVGAIEGKIRRFGLVAKCFSSEELCDVTFLGMMPYPVAGDLYWGPTIGRRLYKAFWQADPKGNLPAWTLGVAKQLALYQCVPVLSEIANRVCTLLDGGKITRQAVDENRVWSARSSATPPYDYSTMVWMCKRYREQGLVPRAMAADVETVERIDRLPAIVRLLTVDASLLVDDL
ncbi:RNA-dependent RNA polymerase [Hubei yanvirus-like virus 1]|uniref:RNA-dependent RNA polymerase n=1 Tax=Hubei yanvirus-like virus 1 TaxID=1923343 RepID=UPI00090A3BF3|nr:RNA-dependent RNA polymerase [Hubei yanvirus-like virus 1]APG78135.1 RNA-dependent RNA polymerase [Hubei yanvirus-like virus 1]